jgi:hypothetical protein
MSPTGCNAISQPRGCCRAKRQSLGWLDSRDSAIYVSFMLLVDHDRRPLDRRRDNDPEALLREARRRRRRRLTRGFLVFALLAGAATVVALAIRGSNPPTALDNVNAGGLPTGSLATLKVAGPLAVGPNGALYVADVARDRILVRVPDGRFRVVAGDGTDGFSGDGGPAIRAELSDISDLAFSPTGSLYVADGGRIRVIGRDGVIRTVAGDGSAQTSIANGAATHSAALGSLQAIRRSGTGLSIAFGPSGQLYISVGERVLRLTAAGRLAVVRAVVISGPRFLRGNLRGFGPIGVDRQGNIDVAGFNGWAVWQVRPSGVAHQVGAGFGTGSQARRSGGGYSVLQRGPDGAVYAENGPQILRIEDRRLVPTYPISTTVRGQYFFLNYFAFGPHGVIYADDIPGGGGFEKHQQLLSVRNSHVSLLWQQRNDAPQ